MPIKPLTNPMSDSGRAKPMLFANQHETLAIPSRSLLRMDPITQTLVIPASVTVLAGDMIFEPHYVKRIKFETGSQIRRLETGTFGAFQLLKSIHIPPSVEFIARHCFCETPNHTGFTPGCNRLCDVIFEPGSHLREIESEAFLECACLFAITIPASVERMGGASFPFCVGFGMEIESGNRVFVRRDDFVIDIERHHLLRYFGRASEVTIPEGIEEIDDWCFYGNKHLCSVVFGPTSRVRSIGALAFEECEKMIAIEIPSSVRFLGRKCFAYCHSLQAVAFSPGSLLESIPPGAFEECRLLNPVMLPSSVKSVGASCFHECRLLANSPFPPDSEVVRIEEEAFWECYGLRSMCIPSSVEFIGKRCFAACYWLSQLTFSSPSHLREFLDFPANVGGLISIPDSVEILVMGQCEVAQAVPRPPQRMLAFGPDSRLAEIRPGSRPKYGTSLAFPSFVQLSARSLRRFRTNLEFDDTS
jgi:hypothetical protein